MSNFILRMRNFFEIEELNAHRFAQAIGISDASVSRILSGKDKPSLDTLTTIANNFSININWLLTGQGSIYLTPEGEPADRRIPIVSVIHAGLPCEAQDGFYGWEYLSERQVPRSVDCAIIVQGDSMSPTLENKDIVYVVRDVDPALLSNGDLVIIENGGGSVIRRLRRHHNHADIYLPDNPAYEPIVSPPTIVQVQGLAKGYRRIFK